MGQILGACRLAHIGCNVLLDAAHLQLLVASQSHLAATVNRQHTLGMAGRQQSDKTHHTEQLSFLVHHLCHIHIYYMCKPA